MKSMHDLMLHFLQDIYYAEKQGIRSMAKMAKSVDSAELKDAILKHRDQTLAQVSRLDQVFEELGKRARGKTCAAMDGLGEECEEAIDESDRGPVLDAALIACAQAIEHYEIARYGALVAWAKSLNMTQSASLLQETLDEEHAADHLLNEIAQRALNAQAAASGKPDEDGGEDEASETVEEPKPRPKPKPAAKKSPKTKPPARSAGGPGKT